MKRNLVHDKVIISGWGSVEYRGKCVWLTIDLSILSCLDLCQWSIQIIRSQILVKGGTNHILFAIDSEATLYNIYLGPQSHHLLYGAIQVTTEAYCKKKMEKFDFGTYVSTVCLQSLILLSSLIFFYFLVASKILHQQTEILPLHLHG